MILNYVMTNRTTIAITFLALTVGHANAADISPLSDDSVIIVSADESWEDAQQNIIYFRGNFEIQMPNWTLTADLATVYGKLNDPKRVVADGSPVHFSYQHSEDGRPSITKGEGQHLEYEKEHNLLKLSGDARIATDHRLIQSSEIQYDLETQKLEAGGAEGVHITIEPDSSGNL